MLSSLFLRACFYLIKAMVHRTALIRLSYTGNFMTQNISNVMSIIGAFLLVFSTWQYTLRAPTCCHDSVNATVAHEFNRNCTEFETSIVLENISFHIPPMLNIALAVIGLTVSLSCSMCNSVLSRK